MLVLGVDPGSRVTGYGLVEKKDRQLVCLHFGTVAPPAHLPFYERIHEIFRAMSGIMERYSPTEMAVEDIFFHKNLQSSLKIGHARGAVLIAGVQCGIRIFEYSPLEIKKSVVGYGRATKEQVRAMIQIMLKLKNPLPLDASDALATAVCHLNWSRLGKPVSSRE
jgi:crossover junction endodeoxyribonuclease RuvC